MLAAILSLLMISIRPRNVLHTYTFGDLALENVPLCCIYLYYWVIAQNLLHAMFWKNLDYRKNIFETNSWQNNIVVICTFIIVAVEVKWNDNFFGCMYIFFIFSKMISLLNRTLNQRPLEVVISKRNRGLRWGCGTELKI